MSEHGSSVFFESNLVPVGDSFHDSRFLTRITDPSALEKLANDPAFANWRSTPLQQEILKKCAVHCTYADKDDYPWGIPADAHENNAAICLCRKTSCKLFHKCRPGYVPEEDSSISKEQTLAPEICSEESRADVAVLPGGGNPALHPQPKELPAYMEVVAADDSEILSGLRQNDPSSGNMESPGKPVMPGEDVPGPSQDSLEGETGDPAHVPEADEYPPTGKNPDCPRDNPHYVDCHDFATGIAARPKTEAEPDMPAGCASFEDFIPMEQEKVISLPASARVLVNAPPGTGKTWTLVGRIRHLVEVDKIHPEEILVLTFTRAAASVIRERIRDSGSEGREFAELDAGTFDSFAFSLLNLYREDKPELCPCLAGLSYENGIIAATRLISHMEDELVLEGCRHVIIDEIQDLSGVRVPLVMKLLASRPPECGFTLLGDSCQSIYDWRKEGENIGMFSADLYSWLMSPAPGITRYAAFTTDHRRQRRCLPDTGPYRKAILAGDKSGTAASLSVLLDKIAKPFPPLQAKSAHKIINSFPANETLGILARTNGMALAVSSILSSMCIQHTMHRKMEKEAFANWIADILARVPGNIIHRDDFVSRYMDLYGERDDEAMAHACWNALAGNGQTRGMEIRDILAGISGKSDPLLWRHAGRGPSRIEVANIFRAKGREYDNVLLVDELFEDKAEPQSARNKDWGKGDEDRVRYVALTRAKIRMSRIASPDDAKYMYKDGEGGERRFKAGRVRGEGFQPKYISHFETGIPDDIDPLSFAMVPSAQEYISEFASPGVELFLRKQAAERNRTIPVYDVCIGNQDEFAVLGNTGKSFGESLIRALKKIYDNPHKVIKHKWFPDSLSGIYVTGITSHISAWNAGLTGATRFGDMALWRGISCHGLAFTGRDTY